ncbi:MAG: methyltransferase [Gemmatimonadetes bacterium]|nr:methyltransferase [Gemmatimonadota bacterium]MBT6149903.1 methyltransferase [Gemmatimonadota bacterium]MBT7864098.1 methyltransferase [Gemmatimonadota bacterium]
MTGRQRVRAALEHRTPDRIPVEFGATPTTGMHVTCVEALRQHYGLEERPVKVHEPYQMLGWIEPDLADVLGLDVDAVNPHKTIFGFTNQDWREFRLPWGQTVLVSANFVTTADANGDLLIYPEGAADASPSGRMPTGGYFFDTIIRQPPIDESALDPEDNLEEFGLVEPETLEHFRAEIERVGDSPRARVATLGGTAFGDIALVPAPFLREPRGIRDVAEWYVSTLTRQDYVHEVFTRQCELALANLERLHAVIGDAIDAVFVCGTDFGTQTSSFCSTETFDSLYAPYYRQVNDWIHTNTDWKCMKHSCGAVESFIPHFIESGFDILNPVQCSATGMDPALLKQRYGDDIVFWGGGVDTQQTLPFGTPDEVRTQVLQRCEIFGDGGGFVFNTVHNVQALTPTPNLVAMFDALQSSS